MNDLCDMIPVKKYRIDDHGSVISDPFRGEDINSHWGEEMTIIREFFGKFYFSLAVLLGFVLWIELSPGSLSVWGGEDYVIENLTALFFLLASIGFFVTARKSAFLAAQRTRTAYVMIIAWAVLMFVFFGEEISWGQRIFDFSTPESLAKINLQQEFNIHNIALVDSAFGGKYRYLSIMMLLTGVVFPLVALSAWGRRLFRKFCFPVCPPQFMLFFLGSYLFGKYYSVWNPAAMPDPNSISETREFIFGLGMACFAFYGALRPDALFLEKKRPNADPPHQRPM